MQILNQDILNLVVLGLREQQVRAYDNNAVSLCEYLTNDGRKCVVGMLIPGTSGDLLFGTVDQQPKSFWNMLKPTGIEKKQHEPLFTFLQYWHDNLWPKHDRPPFKKDRKFSTVVVQESLEKRLSRWNQLYPDDQLSLEVATKFARDFEKGIRNASKQAQ